MLGTVINSHSFDCNRLVGGFQNIVCNTSFDTLLIWLIFGLILTITRAYQSQITEFWKFPLRIKQTSQTMPLLISNSSTYTTIVSPWKSFANNVHWCIVDALMQLNNELPWGIHNLNNSFRIKTVQLSSKLILWSSWTIQRMPRLGHA